MRKTLLILTIFCCFAQNSIANHITGGEIFYTYTGQSAGKYQYHVTLWLFRDHFSSGAQLDPTAAIAVFDKTTGAMVWNQSVVRTDTIHLHLISPSPCINNPPDVWYEVGRYEADVSIPASPDGYIIAYQRCCRIQGINNLTNSSSVGATYTAEIPGNSLLIDAPANSSARFIGSDTVITCANNVISYSFAAIDPDGDQLSYSFCNAYTGGGPSGGSGCPTCPDPNPPTSPPYTIVPYQLPFLAFQPMGAGVNINSTTGLITGIAPASGIYVVTVCVTESRNGVIIATQRKDLQIKVGDCDIARALLNPRPTTCDGFTLNFKNDAPLSPLINSYFWDFGVSSLTNDTSNLATPSFTYLDTGVYVVKLVTNRNQQCSDSTTTIVKVYPGFFPGFIFTGNCYQNPFHFTDTTNTRYGVVDSWNWDFGDLTTLTDVSNIKNPQWTYPAGGPKDVTLIVTNSKGCIDTAQVTITVLDKPLIALAFKDTLICIPDNVTLNAAGTGNFSWTPPVNIVNANTPTPTVNPTTDTWYYVNLNDNGCVNQDSVKVRVTDHVDLIARADTTICLTDGVKLDAITNGLTFQWTPAATLSNPAIRNPIATPTTSSAPYQIRASIGTCFAFDNVTITTVPYPVANAGPNQIICYNTSAQLNGTQNGLSFSWSPVSYLDDPSVLDPVASPPRTTAYTLTVFDNKGCPKPGTSTVVITVNPKVHAYAGRDTSVVVNQPLHLLGTGGVSYLWSPPTGLTSTIIPNPIGVYGVNIDSVKYKLVVRDAAGCPDSAFVTVKVFKTNPYIFVPTAFTPNGDGLNDVVRPISVGIQKINYFSIYNRWGELVFTTTEDKKGWDGRLGGVLQNSGVFVWMVSAVDYMGASVFLKGTVALIR